MILFLLKVMAGIFYGWIGVYYGEMAQMIDTWAYHVESLDEYKMLLSDPPEFFGSLFRTSYEGGYENFLTTKNSWWNDVKANFLIKIMAIFNFFSFGHYYTNVIFYCFLTMFGPIAIYRVMTDIFPNKKLIVLLSTFLVPSFLYWTSGLHKEGLIFLGIALMTYYFYFGFREARFTLPRILMILFGFSLVLILRNFLVITLIPPIVAWAASQKLKWKPLLVYSLVAGLFILCFFTAKYLHPKLDFPQATVIKQGEFLRHKGGSSVAVNRLEPEPISFILNAPQALSLTVIRPYPSDVRHLLSLAAAVEINFLLFIFLIFLLWHKTGTKNPRFILYCLLLSFGILMMIGYTVNILGAIVRYRSIIFPFLVVPMAAMINWARISSYIYPNMKYNNNV